MVQLTMIIFFAMNTCMITWVYMTDKKDDKGWFRIRFCNGLSILIQLGLGFNNVIIIIGQLAKDEYSKCNNAWIVVTLVL